MSAGPARKGLSPILSRDTPGHNFVDGEQGLGEEDFLIERFEEIHQGLFDTTILYFGACTLLILRISGLREPNEDAYIKEEKCKVASQPLLSGVHVEDEDELGENQRVTPSQDRMCNVR